MSETQSTVRFRAPEPAQLASLFPGYEIECLIASGGMGAVYRAVQKSLDRTVAIKILPRELSDDAAFCAGFEAEAKAMARLNHPNLIGVYDFGEVDGMLYIVMEYVPGHSLFHASNGIAIDPAEVIRLVTGICEGLAHAHEHGILHRDIKPSNVLLDLNVQPKIGDFGLARPVDTKVQEGEEIFGTPHYTAPEVVEAPHLVDHRADIFSVGVLLHELLTGLLPADDRRSASAIVHCDPRFDAIIRRATSPQPENRYHSAAEIAADLHVIAISAGPRVLRTAAPAVSNPRTPGSGYRAKISESSGNPMILFVVMAVVIAVVIFVLRSANQPASPPVDDGPPPAPIPGTADITPGTTDITPGTTDITPGTSDITPGTKFPKPETTDIKPETKFPKPETTGSKPETTGTKPETTGTKPETTVPAAGNTPKYDVAGFLDRARKIMKERCAPLIEARDKSLKENIVQLDREAKRLARKYDSWDREYRRSIDDAIRDYVKDCEAKGNRIGGKLPETLDYRMDGIGDVLSSYLAKENAIDAILVASVQKESSMYILGLEKQIERLQSTDDPAAIALIEREISKTRADPKYFPTLMLGAEAVASKPKEDAP